MNYRFTKIVFKSLNTVVYLISYVNHRFYMVLYYQLLKFAGVKFRGKPRYIGKDVKFDNYRKISLGDRIVISNECILLTHDYSITTALISIKEIPTKDIALERTIEIGDNVFIGKRSIIMPNTTIGNNVIIGAGSVIRGKIPDYSVVIGNPCEIVGDIREQALKWKKYLNTGCVRID